MNSKIGILALRKPRDWTIASYCLILGSLRSSNRGNLCTGQFFLKALSQFQLTLVSANSKYDRVIKGIETFNSQEKNGYKLFKKNCAICHQEPLFTNNNFESNGISIDSNYMDYGRVKVTLNPKDSLLY